MNAFAVFFSPSGRVERAPFVHSVIALYLAAFISQILLSPPALSYAGPAAFAFAQVLIAWSWFCLHAKRLRDGNQGIGLAAAVAVLYALAVVLLLLVMALIGSPPTGATQHSTHVSDLFVPFRLVAVLTGDADRSLFDYVAIAVLMLVLAPVLLMVGYSVSVARQPSVAPALTAQPGA